MKNVAQIFTVVVVCLVYAIPASAVVIDFGPLAGLNLDPYNGHVEDGFSVTPTSGSFFEARFVGSPPSSIFLGPLFAPSGGRIGVEREGTGLFTFESVDLSTSASLGSFSLLGWLNGSQVMRLDGGFSDVSIFETKVSPNTTQVLDLLEIVLTPDTGVSSINIDNIVVNAANASVPDNAETLLLLVLALLAMSALKPASARRVFAR